MYKIKRFFRRVYNLYRWLPIIWKDQDWDDHYIWEVLKFKLKNQAEYIKTKGHHVDNERDAQRMMTCVRLIEKLQIGYYEHEYTEYHESESIFTPSEECEDCFEWDSKILSEKLDEYFVKYPRIYIIVENMEKPPFSTDTKLGIAINIGHINHLRATRILFDILENHIFEWWD
jgi:hypothetical protein